MSDTDRPRQESAETLESKRVNPISPSPVSEPKDGITEISESMNLDMIMDIPVDVHVEIGCTYLPVRDFLKLGVGSVLQLDRMVGEPADLIINGKHIGKGDIVVVDETFGVRITSLVAEGELLSSC